MKPMARLVALLLLVLASFTALPSAAKLDPCASFCAIVFCDGSQTCGLTATGCACHDPRSGG
jgi:hypothetical protein